MNKPDQFKKIADELTELFTRKNADYGDAIFRLVDEVGFVAIQTHLFEKYLRISTLLKKEPEVVNESIEDSLRDLANFSIIGLMVLENLKKK